MADSSTSVALSLLLWVSVGLMVAMWVSVPISNATGGRHGQGESCYQDSVWNQVRTQSVASSGPQLWLESGLVSSGDAGLSLLG